ncbi:hypothetical protein GCM10011415_07110 [Salipiger pallidus]|uniref:SCP domain-containing protein n=1 Tax=Salipiger pallidus TaxID=1775170 RepID=A0A8J2ZHG1_9RHOB|nr:CAP domain-containing protein [Salipiger pallidus]GGG63284.1 hypothetical protein GCM10011415_07110 [Salipiger pallidus]
MKTLFATTVLCLPLLACAEIDVRSDPGADQRRGAAVVTPAAVSTSPATNAAPSRDGTGSDGLWYMYGQGNDAPDAAVNPGQALNAYRQAHGLQRLQQNGRLAAAAQAHARDVARMGKVGHTGSNGSTVGARAKAQGYNYSTVGENVAWTSRGFPTVMQIWDDSPGHRKNLRMREATQYGIGRSGDYWVLVVARPL